MERGDNMAKYVYPAVFNEEKDGCISVFFPDLKGCSTFGHDIIDALAMAGDSLSLMLYDMEEDGDDIPSPTPLQKIKTNGAEFASYISIDTMDYRKRFRNKAVKKTLSVPEWLNDSATAAGLNFSQILQEGLKHALNIA